MTGRRRLAALAETVSCAAVAAWVGGHAVLGAYAARIVFRDLPRPLAASTMTTIFSSFDRVIAVCALLLAAATATRVAALGLPGSGRAGASGADLPRTSAVYADLVATVAAVGLLSIGLAALVWVHPAIERLFVGGETLTPRFAQLHRVSERLGHAEVALALSLFGGFAWRRGS